MLIPNGAVGADSEDPIWVGDDIAVAAGDNFGFPPREVQVVQVTPPFGLLFHQGRHAYLEPRRRDCCSMSRPLVLYLAVIFPPRDFQADQVTPPSEVFFRQGRCPYP